jgi:hypothetical protein
MLDSSLNASLILESNTLKSKKHFIFFEGLKEEANKEVF